MCFIDTWFTLFRASLVTQMIKNLPAMQETQVWFLDQEDPLEKGMANHPSILAWRIPSVEEPGGLQSMGLQRVGHDWATNTFTLFKICGKIQSYVGKWSETWFSKLPNV